MSNAQWNYIVQRNVSLIPGRNIIDSFVHPKTNTPPNFTRFVQSSKNLQLKVPEKLRDGGMTISVQSSWQNYGLPSSVMQILKWRASKKLSVMCKLPYPKESSTGKRSLVNLIFDLFATCVSTTKQPATLAFCFIIVLKFLHFPSY